MDFATRQLDTVTEGLTRVDAADAMHDNLGEVFSCILGQRFLLDVIVIESSKLPEVSCVIDVYERPGTHNIHDDMTKGAVHRGCYAVASHHEAIMRIASAASIHSDGSV